jgi:hypothetical protein
VQNADPGRLRLCPRRGGQHGEGRDERAATNHLITSSVCATSVVGT